MESDERILIFAGAGASKAVAPESYPTTIEFFEHLPPSIRNNRLFRLVETYIKESNSDDYIDIELVLWRLKELSDFCSLVTDTRSLPGWSLVGNRLISSLGDSSNLNIGHLVQIGNRGSQNLKTLIDEINARVYEYYSKLPTSEQLDNTWTPLFSSIKNLGLKVEVVTTNYDMVLETALDVNKAADSGWRGSVVRQLETDLWLPERSTQTLGLLTKLHGSVNWKKDESQIYISDPLFSGSHDSHVIIYPGFKGKPSELPFQHFHDYFRRSLESSTAVVFIGFAFRDEYTSVRKINRIDSVGYLIRGFSCSVHIR